MALLVQGMSPAWPATLLEGNDEAGLAEMAMGEGRSAPTAGTTTRVSVASNGTGDVFVHDRQGGGSVEEPLPAELEAGDY